MNHELPPPIPFEAWRALDAAYALARGKPFQHLGRTPETGFDCLGLNRWIHAVRLGLPFDLPLAGRWYPVRFWEQGLDATYLLGLMRLCMKIPEAQVQKGDQVWFRPPTGAATVGHTGHVVDPVKKTFLHAYFRRGRGVTVSCWTERAWADSLFGFARHRQTGLLVQQAADVPSLVKQMRSG